ncbi:MAG: DUF1217 domain-containing protein [Paracoccus sp. (in: a-proteobacteria)]
MPTMLALKLVDATEEKQRELIRTSAQHARAIDHFRQNIADVETVDQLMADPELYGFVMRAFDLEDQIFGKALMSKMLKSDISDPDALVNRLSDPRFKELYRSLEFGTDGVNTLKTLSRRWQDMVVDRYVTRQFIDGNDAQNAIVGRALEFREKAGSVNNVYDILKDRDLSNVLRTALGIPDSVAGIDIDKQADIFLKKLDLADLKDPAKVEKLMRRYTAIADAQSGPAALAGNAAVTLLNAAASGGGWLPVTIDISAISALPSNPYR